MYSCPSHLFHQTLEPTDFLATVPATCNVFHNHLRFAKPFLCSEPKSTRHKVTSFWKETTVACQCAEPT